MEKEARKEYMVLNQSGDLLDMFPDFTGEWRKDKKEFLKYWEENQKVLSNLDVIIEDDIED